MGRAEEDGFEGLVARLAKAEQALAEVLRRSPAKLQADGGRGHGHSRRGGLPVTPPKRPRFGSRVLEKGLAGELSAEISLAYDSLGLICTMRLPIRALEP